MPKSNSCPCSPDAPYADCCAPLLAGDRRAVSAEALMRSRYTAFVVRDVAYLLRTWHPTTRPAGIDPATIPDWQDLSIVRTEKGRASDDQGVVEFIATARCQDQPFRLHEVSHFVQEAGQWLYVDGDIKGGTPPQEISGAKVGRNGPCPCGSGKKFKRCCGP